MQSAFHIIQLCEIIRLCHLSIAVIGGIIMTSRKDLLAATRAALIEAATEQFGTLGFEGASLIAIAQQAGVTTGALYHHFANKQALFEIVAEAVEAQVQKDVEGRIEPMAPSVELLREIVEVSVDVLADPQANQILLIDAPAVFGLDRWREVEGRYGLGALTGIMTMLEAQGAIRAASPAASARLLLSLIIEAARMANSADNPEVTRKHALDFVLGALDGMRR
jgi:AcrR family transcriptional regulator